MTISERLKQIIDMVPASDTVADIGCDHGKVAVTLIQSGKAKRVVCGDISPGSLDKARKLAHASGLSQSVALRRGDGLSVLAVGEADVAVIAGMGGELIIRLLDKDADKAPGTLVLSCNRDTAQLRQWLVTHGYRLEDEVLLFENGHLYPIIRAVKGESRELTDIELEFGPVLLQKKPELLGRFLQRCIQEAQTIRDNLEKSKARKKQQLLDEINERLSKYAEVEKWLSE